MPAYDFYCPHCLQTKEYFFRMDEVPALVKCDCGASSYRKYNVPNVTCTVSQYSQAHGIDMANKTAVADMKARYNDTTGNHLVEAGTENVNVAPRSVDWDAVAAKAKAEEGLIDG